MDTIREVWKEPLAKVAVVMAVIGAALMFWATAASAHTPNATPGCTGLAVTASNYPAGSHVTVVIDGVTKVDKNFGPAYSDTFGWSQTAAHQWHVLITTAPGDDFPPYDRSDSWAPCQDISTTVPPSTTTIPPTTAPTTTVPTTPPTTAPAPVALTGVLNPPPCGARDVNGSVTNPNPYSATVEVWWEGTSEPIMFKAAATQTIPIRFMQGLDVTRIYTIHTVVSIPQPDGQYKNVKLGAIGPWTIVTRSDCAPSTPPPTDVTPPPTVEAGPAPAPPAGTPIDMGQPTPAAPVTTAAPCRQVDTVTPDNPLRSGERLCQALPVTGFPVVPVVAVGVVMVVVGLLLLASRIDRSNRPHAGS